jgi:hypothetical protein
MHKALGKKGYILIVLAVTLPVLLLGVKYVVKKIQMSSQNINVYTREILVKPGICEIVSLLGVFERPLEQVSGEGQVPKFPSLYVQK